MKNHPFDPSDDLSVVSAMMAKGRHAAAFDGKHMMACGGLSSAALAIQYFAEVGDWMPSSVLWLWQPILLLCVVVTLYTGRRSFLYRRRNSTARIYAAAFGAAALSLLVFAISPMNGTQPDALTFAILLSISLGSAFFVLATITRLRQFAWASAGWWLGATYFGYKGAIDPFDFLTLSALLLIFVALPGLSLHCVRRSRSTSAMGKQIA